MSLPLVGITGRARSGKDTFAQAFTRKGYTRLAFADALKEVTALIANEPSHLYFDDRTKEAYCEALGMPRRRALQEVGTGMREALGVQVRVNRVIRLWVANNKHPSVIPDVRFDNEAQAVHEAGGIVVRVSRPDGVGLSGEAAAHVSEAGVSEELIDVHVLNDGTVGDLHAEATKIRLLLEGGAV